MIDELFDHQYREGRGDLNSALSTFFNAVRRTVGEAFAALNRIEYSAPWLDRPGRARSR